jgi:hypothetical protein
VAQSCLRILECEVNWNIYSYCHSLNILFRSPRLDIAIDLSRMPQIFHVASLVSGALKRFAARKNTPPPARDTNYPL